MRLSLLSLAILSVSFITSAQTYQLTVANQRYTPLSDSVSVNEGLTWDDPEHAIPLGFDFTYFDNTIDTFFLTWWGLGAEFSGSADLDATSSLLSAYGVDIIDRGADVLDAEGMPGSLSPISYKLEGDAGNHIFKVEWKNAGFYGDLDDNDTSIDFTNFQLWLYEATDVLELRFGPNSITQPNLAFEGDDGAFIGLFPSYDFLIDEATENGLVLTGLPGSPQLLSTVDLYFDFIDGVIPEGTVYTFEPNFSSIASIADTHFSVYPNPANDLLYIESGVELSDVQIRNALGQVVLMQSYNGSSIDVSSLEAGFYLLEVSGPKGNGTQKILID